MPVVLVDVLVQPALRAPAGSGLVVDVEIGLAVEAGRTHVREHATYASARPWPTYGGPMLGGSGVRALCDQLDAEPLFHASLGSKELFHSNFLAWFVDHHPEAATVALSDWTRREPLAQGGRTERERNHLDLVIRLAGHAPLVIENKVFAPPDESQLDRYGLSVVARERVRPNLCMLSLGDPGWSGGSVVFGEQIWQYRSYGNLAERLQAATTHIADGYARETVERYARIIIALHHLGAGVAMHVLDDQPLALPDTLRQELHRIRIVDGFEKLRWRSAAVLLHTAAVHAGFSQVKLEAGFTRGSPLLEAFMPAGDQGDELGWQYQDKQFRLAARVSKTSPYHGKGTVRATRERYLTERYAGWFEFADLERRVPMTPRRTKATKAFCGYDPDFVYDYGLVPEATVGQLAVLNEAVLRRSLKWR